MLASLLENRTSQKCIMDADLLIQQALAMFTVLVWRGTFIFHEAIAKLQLSLVVQHNCSNITYLEYIP
jgi:hypothetical protein